MMALSEEVHDVLTKVKLLIKESEGSIGSHKSITPRDYPTRSNSDELIDISNIDFTDNETWLYESPMKNSDIKDLRAWLYQDTMDLKDIEFHTRRLSLIREIANIETKKSIDSRTFTRPKKRLNRPSIEQYNEGYFKMDKRNTSSENKYTGKVAVPEQLNEIVGSAGEPALPQSVYLSSESNVTVESDSTTSIPPLDFDYSQPTTSSIFDKIASNANDLDSFQNMSPPSLVNSMCSSTFTNLMENSYIKNDPTLREIRDAELTEAMLQDYDPPAFKSFTDSCSSIGSDTTEGFVKRISDNSFNKLNQRNISNSKEFSLNDTYTTENATVILDHTFMKDTLSEFSSDVGTSPGTTIVQATVPQPQTKHANPDSININNTSLSILNGTYRKSANAKLNNTVFNKSPQYQSNELLNDDLNRTITIVDSVDSNRLNNTKRHSYILDNRKCDSNYTTNLKRNSVGYSAGSTDSLDYMSSLSSSSKGSNKMLNMAEVDALVLQQEQSLQQVMSTPNPASKTIGKLWENNCISPITALDRGDRLSDSDASSNEDYLTVGSAGSGSSTGNMVTACGSETRLIKPIKSLQNFNVKPEALKANPRSLNAIPAKTFSNNKRIDSNLRGSYSNLKTVSGNLKGSYTNLRATNPNVKGSYSNLASTGSYIKGSYSNLKTISNNLKASYTQLKPVVLTNLPHTDANLKVFDPNATTTVSRQMQGGSSHLKMVSDGNLKIAEVAPTLRDIAPRSQVKSTSSLNSFAKPQAKTSALPRPISAIPRPMGSRIPGPRTDSRPVPQTQRYMSRPVSKVNFDGDF